MLVKIINFERNNQGSFITRKGKDTSGYFIKEVNVPIISSIENIEADRIQLRHFHDGQITIAYGDKEKEQLAFGDVVIFDKELYLSDFVKKQVDLKLPELPIKQD